MSSSRDKYIKAGKAVDSGRVNLSRAPAQLDHKLSHVPEASAPVSAVARTRRSPTARYLAGIAILLVTLTAWHYHQIYVSGQSLSDALSTGGDGNGSTDAHGGDSVTASPETRGFDNPSDSTDPSSRDASLAAPGGNPVRGNGAPTARRGVFGSSPRAAQGATGREQTGKDSSDQGTTQGQETYPSARSADLVRRYIAEQQEQLGCGDMPEVYCESDVIREANGYALSVASGCDIGAIRDEPCPINAAAVINKKIREIELRALASKQRALEHAITGVALGAPSSFIEDMQTCKIEALNSGLRDAAYQQYVESKCLPSARAARAKPLKQLLARVNGKIRELGG